MAYDYQALRGKIRGKFATQAEFAQALGMDPASLSLKLNNRRDWTRTEIERACDLLGIPLEEAGPYFFAPLVGKTQQTPAE